MFNFSIFPLSLSLSLSFLAPCYFATFAFRMGSSTSPIIISFRSCNLSNHSSLSLHYSFTHHNQLHFLFIPLLTHVHLHFITSLTVEFTAFTFCYPLNPIHLSPLGYSAHRCVFVCLFLLAILRRLKIIFDM